MNAFAKLDFNHSKLSKAFEDAVVVKLDRAIKLGQGYRRSTLRTEEDIFDLQALVRLLHTLVCLVGCSDDVIEKLLTLVTWSKDEVSDYQRRTLKIVGLVLRSEHSPLYERLRPELKHALYVLDRTPPNVTTYESRWSRELRLALQKMDVVVELKPLVDDQVLDIYLPTSNAVVLGVGPFSYYTSSTHRTAYSKLHQRLLEHAGYKCIAVPYYEWTEIRLLEDKMVYLWSLGRKAAVVGDADKHSVAPTIVDDDIATQTDLEDYGSPSKSW